VAERRTSTPTTEATPAEVASVVAVLLFAFKQQVEASSELQSPLHMPLEDTVSPAEHSLASLPVPPLTLKPVVLSVHFSLQQILLSVELHGLPVHLASEATVVSLAQVLDSFVVAPFNFQPLEQDS